jgi:hypothetical protein
MKPDRLQMPQKLTAGLFAVKRPVVTAITWWLVLAAAFFTPAEAHCGEPALTEYQVKALCLMNFARYTEWPASAFEDTNSPLVIGILGDSRLQAPLQAATSGKTIAGRSIVIRELEITADYTECQILFVSTSETKRLADVFRRVKDKPVLTVGETESFLQQGGIIDFAMRSGRVRFDIDLNAARRAGIQISSKVLSLADEVHGKP